MTFAHAWPLFLIVIPIAWVAFCWQPSRRRVSLGLKGLSFVAILVALAEPQMTMPVTRTGAVVLVDTSPSITGADLQKAASVVAQMERHKGRNWMKVVPFASKTRNLLPEEHSGHFLRVSDQSGSGTNLEAALVSSMAAAPSGYMPRLVLISDGNANEGSTARAIAQLQTVHVPVDTIPLAGRSGGQLRLESVSMPHEAYAGEQIPIDITVEASRAGEGVVQIFADNKSLGSDRVALQAGITTVRAHARVKSSGVTSLSGTLAAGALGEISFEQAIQLKRAKVLYVSQDPPGTGANLLQAFNQADFELSRDAALLDGRLSDVQLIVLNNLDLNALSEIQKEHIEDYVRNGGGLLLIGGERQVYKDEKQMDALDRVLPAKLAPPKTPEGTCVALIIDKSSSMEGRKIELARLSAIGVVDHLRPIDTIGVLMFDNSYQWAVPMRRAVDKSFIDRLISGITPDGGTQIAPALAEAYRKVLASKSSFKHIVLLTDGISEEGDSLDLAREALQHQVTISTVGLGQDVNRSYLEKVAEVSGGRSYFLNEPAGLEQILLKDVQDYTGSTAVEKPLTPIVDHKAEILDGVAMETAPPLKGYARYISKPEAEQILSIDQQRNDPLYVRWQYGLGRVGVFTSDAKSRWAEKWVTWAGFDRFWINISRDLLADTDQTEASAQFDNSDGDILVTYRLAPNTPEPATVPAIFVIGPNGFEKPIHVERSSPHIYLGRLHIGPLRGLFRVRPVQDSAAFPEIGVYHQQEESQDYGANEALLEQLSSLTGGRFNPSSSSIFHAGNRSMSTIWNLWPGFLGLAIALTIAELFVRKWAGLMQGLKRAR